MDSKNTVIGILAHVDSGKTTLAEGILYTCGKLRTPGRVDHGNTLLDNYEIERERGITVFSKQANVSYKDRNITLLDTPGHVDFCAEMERTLQVLDAAILVVSCSDGITGHTVTLWRLLEAYKIPTFIFVNKTDLAGADKKKVYENLRKNCNDGIIDFTAYSACDNETMEEISLCSEKLLDEYAQNGSFSNSSVAEAIQNRSLFPCLFGSALKIDGIDALLDTICRFKTVYSYPDNFSARVYKVSRDNNNTRLTHVKITGGKLCVKDLVGDCKVNQIRIYNGADYEAVDSVSAGEICALAGPDKSRAGDVLGQGGAGVTPLLVPVLEYRIIEPAGTDSVVCMKNLMLIADEIPELNVTWQESSGEIHVHVMGDVQIEILKRMYYDRFKEEIDICNGSVVYKETINSVVEGVGHYEPLKHYAEVHLLLEPGERGSGITTDCRVSTDDLDMNWQRLILTHITEKAHTGVLTGGELTDIKITVIGGRAHIKHTEGGDFRQATYRAIRQGLMKAESTILEPMIDFTLELPMEFCGKAMSDIGRLCGDFEAPVNLDNGTTVIKGRGPFATMMGYGREVSAYSKGNGHFYYEVSGYEPCHNPDEIIDSFAYNPDADTNNPSASMFCYHGAGCLVPWYEVDEAAHVDCTQTFWTLTGKDGGTDADNVTKAGYRQALASKGINSISVEEIEEIYKNTYHKSAQELTPYRYIGYEKKQAKTPIKEKPYVYKPKPAREKYLLVDGYNIIFSWPQLRSLAGINLDSARDSLIDICCNYNGSVEKTLILVFDAYKVKGNPGSVTKVNNIYVVYTKEAETADQYIEKTVHRMAKNSDIIVATSDGLEQMIIYGDGAQRMSSLEFLKEVERENTRLHEEGFVKE